MEHFESSVFPLSYSLHEEPRWSPILQRSDMNTQLQPTIDFFLQSKTALKHNISSPTSKSCKINKSQNKSITKHHRRERNKLFLKHGQRWIWSPSSTACSEIFTIHHPNQTNLKHANCFQPCCCLLYPTKGCWERKSHQCCLLSPMRGQAERENRTWKRGRVTPTRREQETSAQY